MDGLCHFLSAFFVNAGADFFHKLRGEFVHAVGGAGVFGALLQDFLLRFTASCKVAVNANISATDNLCHGGVSFRDEIRLRGFRGSAARLHHRMALTELELPMPSAVVLMDLDHGTYCLVV
jgi:hypothetical protein